MRKSIVCLAALLAGAAFAHEAMVTVEYADGSREVRTMPLREAEKGLLEWRLPRAELKLTERGVVRRRESTFDGGAHVLFTYSRSDLKRYVDGASEVSHG